MIGYALDSNNDLIIRDGTFLLVEGAAQTVQAVRSNLLAYKGEWFLDTEDGVPYFEKIFTRPADLANIESIIKATILNTEGVSGIVEFQTSYDRESRGLTISVSITDIYDDTLNLEVTVNA